MNAVHNWFATSFSIIGEVMQNARRAGATKVEFLASHKNRSLEVIDDGCGIDDFQNLIELATSGWTDEQVQLTEKPFGMGLFSLFYACDRITIRSRGQVLHASLDDIINKRELKVLKDIEPVTKGTRIALQGLNEKLMKSSKWDGPTRLAAGDETAWDVHGAIRNRAKGFDIPVYFNGEALPQPEARRNLSGQLTSIGFVSIAGIHRGENNIDPRERNTLYFLQGLPIGSTREESTTTGRNIVHLDSERFIAVMPDRAHLQDEPKQLEAVGVVLKSILEQHLLDRKALMEPSSFVVKYFDVACEYGFQRLFNDIAYLPASLLAAVNQVGYDWDIVHTENRETKVRTVSREALRNDEIKAWRDGPIATSDGPWAATLLKVMQRDDVADLDTSKLHPEHWVFADVPSAQDFTFLVEPHGVLGSVPINVAWDRCELTLVDSVTVTIMSRVDPDFRVQHELIDDWLVVPVDPEDDDAGDFEGETICYFTKVDKSPDHPCDVFSDFKDEDDFQEHWRDDACTYWLSLMSGLVGSPLSGTIKRALADSEVCATPNQANDLSVVRLVQYWNGDGQVSEGKFDVVNLQAQEFWMAMAGNFGESADLVELAERLKSAFRDTVKPNQLIAPDDVAGELIMAAGYSITRTGETDWYALKTSESKPGFEAVDHNYLGSFSSRADAVQEVHTRVVQDTLKACELSEAQWAQLSFLEQWQHVREAHTKPTESAQVD